MMKALYTSATGMKAHQFLLDVISNNLANVNTTGYKRVQVSFQDLLYDKFVAAGSEAAAGIQSPTGLQVGSGVRVVATIKYLVRVLQRALEGRSIGQYRETVFSKYHTLMVPSFTHETGPCNLTVPVKS